ncbi:hypothetical protein DSUL_140104 [Desulfovibrionales bacterium]
MFYYVTEAVVVALDAHLAAGV